MELTNSNEQVVVHVHAERAYLDYAMTVVRDRALCQVKDGQLPVQRRILYAMHEMGLLTASKPVKSAQVVGQVLGRLHPHGDSAAYGAMVRMAQDFTMRYPLIDGQGNFGSKDGDTAAAMRYTEAKLAPIAELLLAELKMGTVDFVENYDGSYTEPKVLPARLPFTLLNGFKGVAVGMAADGLPHNLREVADAAIALIKNPRISVDELLAIIPGPDFPGGAQVISSPEDIRKAYVTGRGSLRVRSIWRKEDMARGQWRVIVSEVPHYSSLKKVQEQIETLTNPQPPAGKKTITPQQAALKQLSLSLLDTVRDESGKEEKIRLVIYPRSSKQSPVDLMAFLFANTELEDSCTVNNTVIGLDGKPLTKGIFELLQEWVDFRFETVRKRLGFELAKATHRIHILEGRQLVFANVEGVINTIRHAEDSKAELMNAYSLSEIQADDILEMRLKQLARLEGFKIEKELDVEQKEAARITAILADDKALRKLIIKEVEADRDKYADDRRTLIQPEARAQAGSKALLQSSTDDPCTVILSRNLLVRRVQGHDVAESSITFKDGDAALAIIRTRTSWPIAFMDSGGRAYSVMVSELPQGRGDGAPLTTLIEVTPGARVVHALSALPETQYLFAGATGYGYVAQLKAMVSRPKAGKEFLRLDSGELPMKPILVPEDAMGMLAVGSSNGKLLVFPAKEIKSLPKGGKGVMLISLEGADTVSGLQYFEGEVLEGVGKIKEAEGPLVVKGADFQRHLGHRGRKGAAAPKKAVFIG